MNKNEALVSRREFAKAATLVTAAALTPLDLLAQQQPTTEAKPPEKQPETQAAAKLSEASKAEADFAYETLMRKYGSRFDEEQKKDIRRLIYAQQQGLDKLRAFAVSNGDQPATVLKLDIPEEKR